MEKINLIIRLMVVVALIGLVLYLVIERPIEKIAKAAFPTIVSHASKYPKTVENLKFLGTWTLEKYEIDRLMPLHPFLKLYYKEYSGMPILMEMVEWYDNKFKLWNDAKHNVFYQEKHLRYVIKDVE